MKSFDIVGYTYAAQILCPDCVIKALPTGQGQTFDGWALSEGVHMWTEDNLSEMAYHFGIDRNDEYSFDSDYFPKVVFADMVSDEICDGCNEQLV